MKIGKAGARALVGLLASAVLGTVGWWSGVVWAQGAGVPQSIPDAAKRGTEILSAAAAAAGGEAVKKLQSVEFQMAGDVQTPNGAVPIEIKLRMAFPNRARIETNFGLGTITTGFDGKSGWFSSEQGTYDVPADMAPETLRGIDLAGGLGLYKKTLAGKAEAEYRGEKDVAGQKALLVEWNGPSGKVNLYFDPESKLLVGAKYRAVTMQGAFEEERRWSDFRDVDGMKFPFHWVTYRDGGLSSDLTVKEVKMNVAVEAGNFAKPK